MSIATAAAADIALWLRQRFFGRFGREIQTTYYRHRSNSIYRGPKLKHKVNALDAISFDQLVTISTNYFFT